VIGKKTTRVLPSCPSSRVTYACDWSVEYFSNAVLSNRELAADPLLQTPLSSSRGELLSKCPQPICSDHERFYVMALIKRNVQLSASEGIPHALCPMLLVAPNLQMELGNTQLI
jgi:hypothetical protein